jgi:dienelactone hydrolase
MEFVAHAIADEIPTGLTRWPEPPDALLGRVSALVLLYPYCGALNSAAPDRWQDTPPTLFVLAENDTIVSTPDCVARADALRSESAAIDIAILPGAGHGFDQREKSPLSTLYFDADQRDRAREIVLEYLESTDPV